MQDAPRRKLVLVSGYRDPGRQWDLRHERCRGRECDGGCKGYPVTAVPAILRNGIWVGGSRHQHREAADMGGLDLDWLIQNRHRYGLVLTVKSENWHFGVGRKDVRSGVKNPQPTVRILKYGQGASKPAPVEPSPPPPRKGLFMDLTPNEEREILTKVRTIDAAMPRKDFVMRDRRDGRVWVFSDSGRWWVRNMDALSLLIFAGKVQGFGPEGIPNAPPGQVGYNMIDGVPEIVTPTDIWEYQVSLDPSIATA